MGSLSLVRNSKIMLTACSIVLTTFFAVHAYAQENTVRVQAHFDQPKAHLFFSSRTGSFTEGTTFEVPILLDTQGTKINAVELYINFNPHKLAIVKPSNDKSIIAIWLEPPTYSNNKGTAKIIGGIPNGISTASGLVTSITFKALESGSASVSISDQSRILANDGYGTDLLTQFDAATYSIVPKAPNGVRVFSETHPFDDHWYNNNSPVLAWEKEQDVSGFSFAIDNVPSTIPDNTIKSTSTITSFESLHDGLWYFHIKALKKGIWGATSHFLVRIDTEPPAAFTPTQDLISAATANPTLVSFFTTDALSGVDHYEIGVIDKNTAQGSAPLFVQTESPYQVPQSVTGKAHVVVRAFDRAGNVRDESIDVVTIFSSIQLIQQYINKHSLVIILSLVALIILLVIFHYLFGHHLLRRIRRIAAALEKESEQEKTLEK
jgi:hypothetical protein